jgi:hypothetical protein
MVPWKWLLIDGWMSHAVPAYLVQTLVDDLAGRPESEGKVPEVVAEDITRFSIDRPGMAAMGRPWMDFYIDGLHISTPCEDVVTFIGKLKKRPMRTWDKGTTRYVGANYYKLHGFNRCIVLTPDLRFDLIEALEAKIENAEAQATAFYADRKPLGQVLQEANAIAHGLDRDAYKDQDFGGHKNDRFHLVMPKKGDA